MRGRFLSSLLLVITITSIQAQNPNKIPRLVVGLTIDQLRADYIEAFSTLYGEKGFKRLFKEGRIYTNVEYDFTNIDKSSGTAAVYTGTNPSINGILGDFWFNKKTLGKKGSVDDNNYMGIYTMESSSAENLKVSNLTDELMISTRGMSESYSIAPSREMSVLMSGHSSKGAFWINDETGKWCGTTYYGDFPKWATIYNDNYALDYRIDKISWSPFLTITAFDYLLDDKKEINFKYTFGRNKKDVYRRFKTSPYVNDEVNKFVNQCLNFSSVGRDNVPDLLSIAYYAGNYEHASIQESPMELQDAYVRLDESIAQLLEMVDKKIGLENTLFFITSTGYSDNNNEDDIKFRIPTGVFDINRCSALLNLYFNAVYGQGQYIDANYNQEIFLNHKLIESKNLDLNDLLNKGTDFLTQFSGVRNAYSINRLKSGSYNSPEAKLIRNSFYHSVSGDFIIDVMPGWKITQDYSLDTRVVRNIYTSSPLIFFGYNIKPKIINTPINIGSIASTVSHFMRIRAPNACSLPPLIDIRK